MSKPLIRRFLSEDQYDKMIKTWPTWIMYSNQSIDSQHKMFIPRWGFSEKQIKEAKEKAERNAQDWFECFE